MTKFHLPFFVFIIFTLVANAKAIDSTYVSFDKKESLFSLAENGKPVPFLTPASDEPGVLLAFNNLVADVKAVTGSGPALLTSISRSNKQVVIVGTIGHNATIDELIRNGKLDVSSIRGKWEGFVLQVVQQPLRGVDKALVIAGADRRGTIFGMYDLAEKIGVSPWHWWADVPVRKNKNIFITKSFHAAPAVRYRGIFINDEQPALGGWVAKNYGGFNHKFYGKVFELILRLKGNFLWPAMWGQSFFSDDPDNPRLADEMGVVIGTSHHEPMMRAHAEWQRNNLGAWNYKTNKEKLQTFWREGIERMGTHESIVTLAMRGDGDEPMSEESNVRLLQQIVQDQRQIIADVTKKSPEKTPQVWALYKEVQDYYEKGMRVPDDVTLLLCDDNWGNIRKLPTGEEKKHPGGYGIYYHFDYVGDPRNYKWINTNPLPRIWEQMHLAWEYGAREIWIVNVGDIKPMEFPIDFFLDYAFNPSITGSQLQQYTLDWTAEQFPSHHQEIADILSQYGKFNSRRKPELLGPDSFSPNLYSLTHYREAERVVKEYNDLAKQAQEIYEQLSPAWRDAYYQLVLYPVKASANLNEFYYNVRLNHLYAKQGRVSANDAAQRAKELFRADSLLTVSYNKTMAGGKWDHMMDQHHIGYKGWHDDFKVNTLPDLKTVMALSAPAMGIVPEGSDSASTGKQTQIHLPELNSIHTPETFFEIFNRGTGEFDYAIEHDQALIVTPKSGRVKGQQRVTLSVDWSALKDGANQLPLTIRSGSGETATATIRAYKMSAKGQRGFIESNGFVSIEAPHFDSAVNTPEVKWHVLPDHGRTLSGVTSFPVTTPRQTPGPDAGYIEYKVNFTSTGNFKVFAYFSPTIDFTGGDGLEYGISIDDAKVQVVNMHDDKSHRAWQESVKDNIRISVSNHTVSTPGQHVLKFWRVDPGVVLQKIVIDTGGLHASYLGPPESARIK